MAARKDLRRPVPLSEILERYPGDAAELLPQRPREELPAVQNVVCVEGLLFIASTYVLFYTNRRPRKQFWAVQIDVLFVNGRPAIYEFHTLLYMPNRDRRRHLRGRRR